MYYNNLCREDKKMQNEKNVTIENREAPFFLKIEPVRDDIVRVRFSKEPIKESKSLLIEEKSAAEKKKAAVPAMIQEGGEQSGSSAAGKSGKEAAPLQVTCGKLHLSIDTDNGNITWSQEETGRLLLKEAGKVLTQKPVYLYTTGDEKPVINRVKTVDGERNFVQNLRKVEDRKAYRGQFHFAFQAEEGIYGFGQAEEGIYNLRHHNQYLYQHNMRIPMPMFYSSEGYGILFDCCSLMTFEDDENGSYLFQDTIDQMDYYFVMGPDPDDVIDGFRYLTGKAAMLPKWAYGYIQSKEQYYSAKELLSIVQQYRKRQVPLDCVVQDWNSWEPGNWGEKKVDLKRYGDLRECMDEIHALHAHSMVSVWPNMNSGGSNYEELSKAGCMLMDCATYNAFDEKARKIYWKQAKEGLFDGGFDSWWCDSTEPFSGPDWGGETKREPWERYELVGEEHKKYLDPACANAFALMHAKGIYENQRAETEQMRVLNLTRSGYASGQKYAAMLWSGDTTASWETLQKQIVEGLNMGLSGYPYWTLDIGGFFTVGKKWQNRGCSCNTDSTPKWFWQGAYDEGVKDAGYRELYVRWLEFGTFLPMFRSHGTDTPREIWNFGEKGDPCYDAIEKFIRLRYLLMPYVYSLAGAVYVKNATIMRSLLFDFREDPMAGKIRDEFLFGPSLLICPVTEPMYYEAGNRKLDQSEQERSRICYLPDGADWIDFWTGEKFLGGQSIRRKTPLDRIPIFVKAGAVLPMQENLQYAEDQKTAPIILQITGGADSSFTFYEDAGNDYGYEKGEYATTQLDWNDTEKTLTIGTRQGNFPGMLKERTFLIHRTEKDGMISKKMSDKGSENTRTVNYNGEALKVRL